LEWRPCRLIDVSTAGAAIEPFAPLSFDALGSPVAVQFKLPGIDETFELHGDIRHTTRTSQGHVHLGIEFTNLTALDVRLLDLINRGLSLN
jgi:hypothetical protein